MEDPPEEEMSGDRESPMEILDKICEEMKNLLTSAETLLQPELGESLPAEVPEVEQA